MKTTKKAAILGNITLIVLLILSIVVLCFENIRIDNQNWDQVSAYVQELATTTADHLADIFEDKQNMVRTYAKLTAVRGDLTYEEWMESLEFLNGFDLVSYASENGNCFLPDGSTVNCSEENWFRDGKKGNTGSDIVKTEDGFQAVFYAPVTVKGEVIGVAAGFLKTGTISAMLGSDFYGYSADALVLSEDGNILGRFNSDDILLVSNIDAVTKYIAESDREGAVNAVRSHTMYTYRYQGTHGESMGNVVPIRGTSWSFVQMIPSEVLSRISKETNYISLRSIVEIIAIFMIALVIISLAYRGVTVQGKREKSEVRLNTLLRNLSDDFLCLIDVNLETEEEEQFRLGNGHSIEDWSEGSNKYSDNILRYANSIVAEYDRDRFIRKTKLTDLKEKLKAQPSYYIEYDAFLGGERRRFQGKFTIAKDDAMEPHMLVRIRDITDINRERMTYLEETELVAEAMGMIYPFVMIENLTRNTTRLLHNNSAIQKNVDDEGEIDKIIRSAAKHVPEGPQRNRFIMNFNYAAQLELFDSGNRRFSAEYDQMGDDGVIHTMKTYNIYRRGEDGEIRCISLTRELDENGH